MFFSARSLFPALSLLFLIAIAGSGCSIDRALPDPGVLKAQYPLVHYHGKDKPFTVSIEKARPSEWVSLDDISKVAVGAIIVSEDWAFYQHKGYDPNQIKEAIQRDIDEGRFARGASTITQQVVKNVFLEKDKNLVRKVKEIALAVKLEEKVKKRRILEVYLNIAEWGEGVFGIGPAARFYFNKAPRDLTAKEGAFLAMLLPSPKRYSQSFRQKRLTDYASETVESILFKMTQAKYISEDQRDLELQRPLPFETAGENPGS